MTSSGEDEEEEDGVLSTSLVFSLIALTLKRLGLEPEIRGGKKILARSCPLLFREEGDERVMRSSGAAIVERTRRFASTKPCSGPLWLRYRVRTCRKENKEDDAVPSSGHSGPTERRPYDDSYHICPHHLWLFTLFPSMGRGPDYPEETRG